MTNSNWMVLLRESMARILILALCGAVLGAFASVVLPDRYSSSSTLLLMGVSADPAQALSGAAQVDVETEVVVAQSRSVGIIANSLLAGEPPAGSGLRPIGTVDARSVGDSRIMRISFESESAEKARRGADAYAKAYLSVRTGLLNEQRQLADDRLSERVEALTSSLAELDARIAQLAAGAGVTQFVERETIEGELEVSRQALTALRTATTDVATIVDPAQLPLESSSLGLATLVVGGAALALAAGIGLALVRDAVAQRPHGTSPVAAEPVDTVPPQCHPGGLSELVKALDQASRPLRQTIHNATLDQGHFLLVVDDDQEVSSAGAFVLGTQLASAGLKTLVLETALVSPSLSQLSGSSSSPGLSDFLSGDGPSVQPQPHQRLANLLLMPFGSDPGDVVEPAALVSAVKLLSTGFDALVVSAGRPSRSAMMRSAPDGALVIVVTRAAASPSSLPAEELAAIRGSTLPLAGIVSAGAVSISDPG